MSIKVLNLYAGIGGNRKLWKDVEVTAIEIDQEIARIYQDFFPEDKVIITDAHKYLLNHYKEFDFIWSSPPCPTHSVTNHFLNAQGVVRYPDMSLWQEILFLKTFCHNKWVVENVKSYYQPIYKPYVAGRHYFWSNFYIDQWFSDINISIANARASTRRARVKELLDLEKYHGFFIGNYTKIDRRKVLRNCVRPQLGLHVFNCAFKERQEVLS